MTETTLHFEYGKVARGYAAPDAAVRRSVADMSWQEKLMGITKDQVRGYVEEAKGAIKEAAGKLVGNPTLEVKGKIERNLGRAQATIVKLRRDVRKASK